ncbi:hypothetical protein [Streptomyces sp. NPDC050264]|uniref:hypothetical protein n=1 Tax=Streptomyces sp. NPDC050264 TaxID=3155038 RepID=UPI0034371F6F
MKASWPRGLMAVVSMLLVAGCFAPQAPMFGDGHTVPEEASRTPLPVRPGPDGTWALNLPDRQLLGQGRVLAHLKSPRTAAWRTTLPDEFRLSAHDFGAPHSAGLVDFQLLVVGGRKGHRGPSTLAAINVGNGRLTWRRKLPPGSQVFASGGSVLAVGCRDGSCRITAWAGALGERQWTRTVRGAVRVLDSCGADALRGGQPRPQHCYLYVITPDRVGVLNPEDGGVNWVAGLRPPDGMVDRITQQGDRTILITAPAKGSCRVTVLASGVDSGDGDRGWRHTFVWDQPQAPRDPRTGCHWDRALPLALAFRMVLPDAEGALLVDPYFGTLHPYRRLARGEYLTSQRPVPRQDLPGNVVIRAPGRPDRLLTDNATGRVRPRGLSPSALALEGSFWQDGHRLVLFGDEGETLWKGVSACQAYSYGGLLTYCDGSDLVTLQPAADN